MANQLESCRISPATNQVTELTLPITFFDVMWIYFHPIKRLLFYEFPCSTLYFTNTIIPNLKQSLALALKHYLPLAGNLLIYNSSKIPEFRYVVGDSISLTVAESNNSFDDFTGNHLRDADPFHSLIPNLPPPKEENDYSTIPLFAVQVTCFPDRGICIGFMNHHVIGDASSIVTFMKAWASINKFNGEAQLLEGKYLSYFDRSVVKDPKGVASILWDQLKKFNMRFADISLPMNKFRATYIMNPSIIQKLKNLVVAKRPNESYVSTFTVTIAFVWTCLVKSDVAIGEKVDDDEFEYFGFVVDCRTRMDPPLPTDYFGNCLGYIVAKVRHGEIVENEGFLDAAVEIGREIKDKVNKKGEILKGIENWIEDISKFMGKRVLSITGSPKFDLCDVDYGWGRPKKLEYLGIDGENALSICKSRESDGGLEVGLSLPRAKASAFATIFANGLANL